MCSDALNDFRHGPPRMNVGAIAKRQSGKRHEKNWPVEWEDVKSGEAATDYHEVELAHRLVPANELQRMRDLCDANPSVVMGRTLFNLTAKLSDNASSDFITDSAEF